MSEVLAATVWPLVLVVSSLLLWPRSGAARLREQDALVPGGWRARLRELGAREVRLTRRGGSDRSAEVADFAELSAVGLDAGLSATAAARLACEVSGAADGTVWQEVGQAVARAEATGGSLSAELRGIVRTDDGLAFLAAAWHLTEHFGVAAAPAARTAADVLRERASAAERRGVLLAGPRASMWLLTFLPLSGPGVAVLLGLPVGEVYGEPVALGATAVGLLLTALGWWWCQRLLRRAARATGVE